jgi:hypothetical protein
MLQAASDFKAQTLDLRKSIAAALGAVPPGPHEPDRPPLHPATLARTQASPTSPFEFLAGGSNGVSKKPDLFSARPYGQKNSLYASQDYMDIFRGLR